MNTFFIVVAVLLVLIAASLTRILFTIFRADNESKQTTVKKALKETNDETASFKTFSFQIDKHGIVTEISKAGAQLLGCSLKPYFPFSSMLADKKENESELKIFNQFLSSADNSQHVHAFLKAHNSTFYEVEIILKKTHTDENEIAGAEALVVEISSDSDE